jgi:hypothetical protein
MDGGCTVVAGFGSWGRGTTPVIPIEQWLWSQVLLFGAVTVTVRFSLRSTVGGSFSSTAALYFNGRIET